MTNNSMPRYMRGLFMGVDKLTNAYVQTIIDGDADASTLSAVVNGDDKTDVTTRLGESYPTVKKAIKLMTQSGVGFTPFETKTEMTGSLLANDAYAIVTNDTLTNSGLYLKKSGTWSKVTWDIDERQKEYTDAARDLAISAAESAGNKADVAIEIAQQKNVNKNDVNNWLLGEGQNLLILKDANDSVYGLIDNDGKLKLVGLEVSVQDSIHVISDDLQSAVSDFNSKTTNNNDVAVLNIEDSSGSIVMQLTASDIKLESAPSGIVNKIKGIEQLISLSDGDSISFLDNSDQVLAKIDNKGDFKIAKIPDGIAKRLNIDFLNKTSKASNNDAKCDIHISALSKITSLQVQSGVRAPIPLDCVPLDFTPPDALLTQTITQPPRISVDTPYRNDDGVVHPHVLQFADSFNHKKYWLGVTPYYKNQDKFENPTMLGGDTLDDFAMFNDYPQPLAERPVGQRGFKNIYNSDIFNFYDFNTGDLCCGWRQTKDRDTSGREVSLLCRRTKDGVNWSELEIIMPSSLGDLALSPSIIYDFKAKKYYLYVITSVSSQYELVRYETNRIGGQWTNKTLTTGVRATGADPWHADVRYIGNKIGVLIHDNFGSQNIYFGMSSDGLAFNMSPALLTGVFNIPYKGTFTFSANDLNQVAVNYIWTSNEKQIDPDAHWRLYSTKTNYVDII